MTAPAQEPFAIVGGWCVTELVDITSDVSALDGSGFWVAVLPYDGSPVCARFARRRRGGLRAARPWRGPREQNWRSSLGPDEYGERVRGIRAAIAAGDVYQVNLTRRLSAPLPGDIDIAGLGAALAAGNPAPHAAVVNLPSVGVAIASASPERFLRRSGDLVESRPIKGTAVDASSLTPKDHAENVMIVDLVRNDLGRVCETGSVSVPGLCELEDHPGLVHLVSTVRGRLRHDVGWSALLDATFPPGSVTGAPKVSAMTLIKALEPVERGPYCGAVGWVDADRREGDLNVAIRTFWTEDGALHFGTGGAITWDSDPSGEWDETVLKAKTLLGIASAVSTAAG